MTPRTKAFNAWFAALMSSGLDLGTVRAARAEFEAIAGKQNLGEMCGDFVQELTAEKPGNPRLYEAPEAPAIQQPVREGTHRAVMPAPKEPFISQKTPEKVAIGRRIKSTRLQGGYKTAVDFAAAHKISRSSIASIEAGHSRPSDRMLQHIATALGVSADWLRTGQGQPFAQAA